MKEEELMDTHLLIGVAVMLGLIGIAASRDLLRRCETAAATGADPGRASRCGGLYAASLSDWI